MTAPKFKVGDSVTRLTGCFAGEEAVVAKHATDHKGNMYTVRFAGRGSRTYREEYLAPYGAPPTTPTQLPEVSTMSNISKIVDEITTVTFVNNIPITSLTDEAIVSLITETGAEINRLKDVAPKPKRVQARIDMLQANLQQLVELVDALDSAPTITERLEAVESKLAASDK